jgi:phosphoglycerate kinase
MPKDFLVIDDLPFQDKTVILRVDINSPVDPESGKILGLNRIKSHLKTIEYLKDSKLVILGHQSRPGRGDFISLDSHAESIQKLLKRSVTFIDDLFGRYAQKHIKGMEAGDITVLQNVRFYSEEVILRNSPIDTLQQTNIIRNLSELGDFFVNDAFAAAHRQQPTIVGFTELLPSAAGLVMERELNALNKVLTSKLHPSIAILGGAKVKDSLEVAQNMLKHKIADKVLTTGLVANIFLLADGKNLGSANLEFLESEFNDLKEITETAKKMLKKFKDKIAIPVDVAVNKSGTRQLLSVKDLPSDYLIHDIGLETIVKFTGMLKSAKVIIANGPAGVFELDEFSLGTDELFLAIANSKAYSVLGGGETLTSIDKLGINEDLNHISTGGGACINYLAGRKLPGVEALKNSKKIFSKTLEI